MTRMPLHSAALGRHATAPTLAQGNAHGWARKCAIGIVLLLLVVPACGQTPDTRNRNQERELAAMEKQWWDSIRDHDRATLERVLADDFMGVDNGGEPATTKQQWVDWAMTFPLKSYVLGRVDMTIAGETAIVAVHYSTRVVVGGVETSDQGVDMDIFVRREGRWQALGTGEIRVAAND